MKHSQRILHYLNLKKSCLVAYILWFVFGLLGVHRFYVKRAFSGIVQFILLLISLAFIGYFAKLGLAVFMSNVINLLPSSLSYILFGADVIHYINSLEIPAIYTLILSIAIAFWLITLFLWAIDFFIIVFLVSKYNLDLALQLDIL
ncbi:NINE protein [Rickettsiales bacterium LUAb2]